MGGAKVDDKLQIIESILAKCDKLILTGGLLNTFLKVLGKNRALIGLIISSLGTLTAVFLPNALNTYLFKDYFQAPGLLSLAGLLPMVSMFIVLPFTSKLVAKFICLDLDKTNSPFIYTLEMLLTESCVQHI